MEIVVRRSKSIYNPRPKTYLWYRVWLDVLKKLIRYYNVNDPKFTKAMRLINKTGTELQLVLRYIK